MTAPAPLWSFLGPAGTFTEMALRQVAPVDVELDPCPDVPTALDHLRERTVEAAVVPIENSVEGGVNATLDNLVASTPLVIAAEMAVPITFVLAGRPGTRLEDVRAISTHPHAWAQCRGWVHQNLPEAVYVAGTSTSAPARALATTEGDTGFQAVLCNPLAAKQYRLEVIAGGVADNPDAVTRFVKVTRPGRVGEPTGADKTTLLVHLPHDRSGALLDMLEQFSARGVNLSRIESRPVGDSLGRYRFSIDVEGHVREERVQAALIGLHRTCPVVRFLGSYPRLDARPTAVLAGTSDKDFVVARSWVADVLDGRAGVATAGAGAATGDARISRLADDALHARASQATVMRAGALLMGLAVALLVWAAVALRDPKASRREVLRRRVTWVAVCLSGLPTALLLVNAAPWWRVGARAGSPSGWASLVAVVAAALAGGG